MSRGPLARRADGERRRRGTIRAASHSELDTSKCDRKIPAQPPNGTMVLSRSRYAEAESGRLLAIALPAAGGHHVNTASLRQYSGRQYSGRQNSGRQHFGCRMLRVCQLCAGCAPGGDDKCHLSEYVYCRAGLHALPCLARAAVGRSRRGKSAIAATEDLLPWPPVASLTLVARNTVCPGGRRRRNGGGSGPSCANSLQDRVK
jgi:hypothetical protein